MSMNYKLYIGPYLWCLGPEADVWEITNERLHELRGEYASEDTQDVYYIGPNVEIKGIDRKMDFDKYDVAPVEIAEIDRQKEIDAFLDQFAAEITALRNHYWGVKVKWGAVPGYC